jgi:hypothetical protein
MHSTDAFAARHARAETASPAGAEHACDVIAIGNRPVQPVSYTLAMVLAFVG